MNDDEKKARLAEALRANLRKRKAQAREQSAEPTPQSEFTQAATKALKS